LISDRSQKNLKLRHVNEIAMVNESNHNICKQLWEAIRTDVRAPPAYKNMAVKAIGTAKITNLRGNYKLSRTIGLILYRTVKDQVFISPTNGYQPERARHPHTTKPKTMFTCSDHFQQDFHYSPETVNIYCCLG
jgi:hypothetical protein